jgi:capsid assembly protease
MSKILDFYASKSWAILEANLQEMYEIYRGAIERKALDGEFSPEAVAAKIGRPLDNARAVTVRDGIAIVPVSGPIFRYANLFTQVSGATSIEVLATDLRQALDDRAVQGIILEINSPGGEVDGTSEFAQHIFDARGEKPIVAYVSHLGASAAYWIASAADEVVVSNTASVGSIGVVGAARLSKDKNLIEFVSSQTPNKRPNLETESGRAQIQKHIDDIAAVFIETVARNRAMSAEDVTDKGGAGGLKVGQLAVDSGLADRVGTLESVLAEMTSKKWERKPRLVAMGNLNDRPVLQDDQSQPGANDMPDEKKTDETPKAPEAPKAEAIDDKTFREKISSFFSETFSASSDTKPPVVTTTDADRLAIEQAQTEAAIAKAEAADAKKRIAQLEQNARATRFESLAKEWPGEAPKHVAMLELLATSVEGGEESQSFKDYVTQQKAIGEQLKAAKLFEEVGSSAPVEGSITAKVEADIKAVMIADPKLTYEQAFDRVRVALPAKQRAEYDSEQRRSVN